MIGMHQVNSENPRCDAKSRRGDWIRKSCFSHNSKHRETKNHSTGMLSSSFPLNQLENGTLAIFG
jgi:hypothetical protein